MSDKNAAIMNQLRLMVIAVGLDALEKLTVESYNKVRVGYTLIKPVVNPDGSLATKLTGDEISKHVQYVLEGARGAVFIVDKQAARDARIIYDQSKESDIRRNPFLAAWMMLNNKSKVKLITNLKVK